MQFISSTKKKLSILLICNICYLLPSSATKLEKSVNSNDSTLLTLKNVNLVDVKKGIIKTNQEIVIKAGKIFKVRKTSSKAGQGKVLNLEGVQTSGKSHLHLGSNVCFLAITWMRPWLVQKLAVQQA